jgi:hypothetical protein
MILVAAPVDELNINYDTLCGRREADLRGHLQGPGYEYKRATLLVPYGTVSLLITFAVIVTTPPKSPAAI